MLTSALARHRRAAALAATGALALGVAACGGDDESSGADPASAAPASAPIYFEAVVRPEGDLKSNAEAALGKILDTDDVGAEIEKLLDDGHADSGLTYGEDIEPWLGERLGGFITGFSGDEPDMAIVVASTDDEKARAAIEKGSEGGEQQTYEGVDYWVEGDTVAGVTDGLAIFGTERAFRAAVDTLKGDDVDTIDDSDAYEDALDAVDGDDDALAVLYVNTPGVLDAVARSGGIPQAQLEQVREQLESSAGTGAVAKVGVSENAISVESAALGVEPVDGDSDSAAAVAALPGDAWLALGIGAIGDNLQRAVDGAKDAGKAAGVDVETLLGQIRGVLGIDVEQELLSWMGDGALFVRGSGIADLGGAVVVETSDQAATANAIVKVSRLIRSQAPGTRVRPLRGVAGADAGVRIVPRNSPIQVLMATGNDKFVVGFSETAVEEALSPQTTLADSEAFKAAADALGDGLEPSFFFDVAPTLQLAEGFGAGDDESFAQAKEYLSQFGSIAGGASSDGDIQRGKLVITLK
jgi:hypothetical protein